MKKKDNYETHFESKADYCVDSMSTVTVPYPFLSFPTYMTFTFHRCFRSLLASSRRSRPPELCPQASKHGDRKPGFRRLGKKATY